MLLRERLLKNKSVWCWAIAAGILTAVFAVAPQIDLWAERGADWQGAYAITDYDEPFYAAYLQSLIDGKPRRNSPYTGAADSAETPQKESYLAIQFLASYPTALVARAFGLSPAATMIWLGIVIGFLAALVFFRLIYIFVPDAPAAFVGTLVVLFLGATAAGQGDFFNVVTGGEVHYSQSLIFMRRTLPATGFPALFLFFIFVWKFVAADAHRDKILWGIASVLCFSFTVFSYFYFWTTAIAWFFGLVAVWAIFRFDDLRANKIYVASVASGFLLPLIPYMILLQNRSTEVDSALVLSFTREPDLWRIPELVSYAAILVFAVAARAGWIDLRERKFFFLLSFALVAPLVFNQQILSGRILQPFHYQFFSANYIAVFALVAISLHLIGKKITIGVVRQTLLALAGTTAAFIGYSDTMSGVQSFRKLNLWRDDLVPVARRIKELSAAQSAATPSSSPPSVVLSFDFNGIWGDGIDIPALTSQPVLWQLHITMFPDVGEAENLERLHKFLYYQKFSEARLKGALINGNVYLTYAFFGADKTSKLFTGTRNRVAPEDIERVVERYAEFCRNFGYEQARTPEISFLLINKIGRNDLSAVDRWYERDGGGETVGDYILYRVKLRNP